MKRLSGSVIKTGGGVDLAFSIVVLASYFATFSSVREATTIQLVLMIGLGMAYLTLGIYGYAFCARLNWLPLDLTYFTVQIILGCLIVFLGKGAGFNAMVLLPLAGQAVVLLPQRLSYGVNLSVLLAYALTVFLFSRDLAVVWGGLPIFLAGLIFIVVFTQMAVSEEKARSEVERLVGELQESNQRLREFVSQVEELAIAKERNRLAREIHDGLGHYLTTIHMQIQASRALLAHDPLKTDGLLSKAQALTQDALVDVRRSVGVMRSDPSEGLPLAQLIERMLQGPELGGIQVSFEVLGEARPISPQVHLTLYRAAQEGINNICKHAQASQAWLALDFREPKTIGFSVLDNGVGKDIHGDHSESGFGLMGLRERVLLLDGSFEVDSQPGHGFAIQMVVPG